MKLITVVSVIFKYPSMPSRLPIITHFLTCPPTLASHSLILDTKSHMSYLNLFYPHMLIFHSLIHPFIRSAGVSAGSKEKDYKNEHKSPQPAHRDEKQGSSNSKHTPSPRKPTHASPNEKTPPTANKPGAEGGDNPPDFTTCMFCGASDKKWNEDALDLHYWKVLTPSSQPSVPPTSSQPHPVLTFILKSLSPSLTPTHPHFNPHSP